MIVQNVMTRNPYHVSVTDSVAKAAAVMQSANIRHLLVVDRGILIGIISINDIPQYIKPQLTVFDIMTPNPKCVQVSDNVKDARTLMYSLKVASLPVLQEGQLVGIVTLKDVT